MSTLIHNAPSAAVSKHDLSQRPPSASGEADASVALREHATPVRARRRQRLALETSSAEAVYIVRVGMLSIEAAAPGKHRQLLALFYPGDIIRKALIPEMPGVTLSALNVAEVWRLPARSFEALLSLSPSVAAQAQRQLEGQYARAAMHGAIVGGLSGDERFAALLIELGLRLGVKGPSGVAFESPMSRTDVADYLALNADTLSRITSRFKTRGLLLNARSGHTTLPAWETLCEATPISGALQALHAPRAA